MHKGLIYKELRQCWFLGALTLLACIGFAWWGKVTMAGYDVPPPPLIVNARFWSVQMSLDVLSANFLLCSGLLAIALGLLQSAWEQVGGTWYFLMHRPIPRGSILTSKLIAGLALWAVCSSIPLALYIAWAATPGTHPSPFAWWMVSPVLHTWVSIPMLYLAAFQCGLLPNRWHGTRLLPCVAIGGFCFAMQFLPAWWLTGFPVMCVVIAMQLRALYQTFSVKDF
jgi:hypothetical protein